MSSSPLRLSKLRSRKSTLAHSLSLDLGLKAEKLPIDENEMRSSILALDGKCEYCGIAPANSKDHFYSIVKNGMATEYCNDMWNVIPACSRCNSSKGGKSFKEWLSDKNVVTAFGADRISMLNEKFSKYDSVMKLRCKRKRVSKACFEHCINLCMDAILEVERYLNEHPEAVVYHKGENAPVAT